ncbi:WG repeat-containing protein [Marivirga tractuosa]|uniref:WG repeat-containing protein n=1 Tax=Marivirga tractuosa TaxID=1006 RepID=UPI0035CED5C1
MRQLLFFLITITAALFFYGCAYKVLKADKFLEKNELGKAKKRIDKAIEKNPENPAAQYMLAKYYSHPVWSFDAVDSAHLYIQLVSDTFPELESKTIEKLAKKDLDSLAIVEQSLIIDSLAFEKALAENSEEAYNEYLNNYQYLTFEEKAIELRNQVAYDDAIAKNTTQAVSDFFKKYPDAPQAQKARNVFETLYYEKKTQNEALEEYREYVKERPQTEFAEEASSKILNIISAGAESSDYQQFINQYGEFKAAKIAQSILDGLNYDTNTAELLTHKKDSLFYFYNLDDEKLLSFQFNEVIPDSCSFIVEPFIISNEANSKQVYLKNGEKIPDLNIKTIEYLESGFFQINDYGREENIIHFSLNDVLKLKSLDFKALDEFHFAKKEEDGWHLISILGEPILKQSVDSIWKERDVFFFKRGNDMAVASSVDFKKTAKNDLKSLSFLYDDYEWLGDQYLRLYSNDYETILDHKAQVIFPLEKAKIEFYDDFWVKNKEGSFSVLGLKNAPLFEEEFDDYQFKSGVLALKKDSLWSVFNDGLEDFPNFQYDSIRIFNSWLTYTILDSSEYLLFQSGKKVQLEEGESYRLLKNYNIAFSEISDQIRFLEISNEKSYFKLYNGFGRKIKEGERLDINILTPKFIQIHQNKKKELIDSAGNEIKIKNVEAFGAYQDGLIPILQKKKFGALRVDSLQLIPAHSENKLDVFVKDSLFIFKEDNLLGISNTKAEVILEADFEAIDFFNDSTAIVEEEGEIGILNIYQNEYLHEGIDTWKKVFFMDENYFIVRKNAGYGVVNQQGEEIIPFIFNELQAHESKDKLYWLAERRLSEINYIVIAYFDKNGRVLFKEGLNFDEYLETACD